MTCAPDDSLLMPEHVSLSLSFSLSHLPPLCTILNLSYFYQNSAMIPPDRVLAASLSTPRDLRDSVVKQT